MNRTHRFLSVLTALMIGALAHNAAAQGTDGRLPNPINANDLARYAEILQLSREQIAAAEGFLEQYHARFRGLRDGDIEAALVADHREFAKRQPSLLSRIAALDEEFFQQFEPILSDAQCESLPYARLVRERDRYMSIRHVRNLLGNALPDLATLLAELDLAQEERDAVRSMMLGYQQRIASGLRGIFEISARLSTAEHGQADPDDVDRLVERAKELRRFNRQTARTFVGLIPDEEQSLRFHRAFFRIAYAHAYQFAGSRLLPDYDALLRSTEIDEEGREAVRAMRRDAISRQNQLLERAADVIDEAGIVGRSEEFERYPAAITRLREEANELREALVESLKNRFGALPASDDDPGYTFSQSMSSHPGLIMTRTTTLVRARSHAPEPPTPTDQFIPPAISSNDVARYARLLAIDDDDESIAALESLHEDYLTAHRERIRPLLVQVRELRGRAEDRENRPDDPAGLIDDEFELRAAGIHLLHQVDAGFFTEVAETLDLDADDERLARLRFDRSRDVYNRGQSQWRPLAPSGPNRAAFVDLVRLVESHLTAEHRATVASLLDDYRTEIIEVLRERYRHMQEREKTTQRLWVDMRTFDHEGYIRLQQAVRRAHHAASALNQRMIDRIVDAVGWEAGWPLLDAFQREAYPEAFDDAGAAEPALAAAFELPDLRPHQRERLESIVSEHRPAYAALREAIIELCADFVPDLPGDMVYGEEDVMAAQRDFNKAIERLKFERDVLNRTALRELRAALDQTQYDRVAAAE